MNGTGFTLHVLCPLAPCVSKRPSTIVARRSSGSRESITSARLFELVEKEVRSGVAPALPALQKVRGRNSFLTFLHRRHLVRCRFSFAVKHWGEQHESVTTVPLHAWVTEFADAHDIAGGDHSHLRLCDRPERSIRGTESHWTGWYRSEWQL